MAAGSNAYVGPRLALEPGADGSDEELIGLCAAFVRRAEARTTEGDRLDDLPWSSDVDAGYEELARGAGDHRALLDRILATTPRTIPGLVAKARVISRHQADQDAEPILSRILADDVIRVHGSLEKAEAGWPLREARRRA